LTSSTGGGVGTSVLLLPVNQSTSVSISPSFAWNPVSGATGYQLQISRSEDFNITEADISAISGNSYSYGQYLEGASEFFWRVRANNECVSGSWSSTFAFDTEACFIYHSDDVPISISPNGTPAINSYRLVGDRGSINDVDVINLSGSHSYVNDLRFTLFTPNNTNVRIWDRPCMDHDNFNINFDQSASPGTWPCPPINGGTYQPSN